MSEDGTVLIAAGRDRRTLITITGVENRTESSGKKYQIKTDYIPVGAYSISLDSTDGLNVGDMINIVRPCTQEWMWNTL